MEKTRYMISDASNIVNVEAHVLRYWEEELDLNVPRNEMGHRYYTKENIQQFMKIKELKEKGYQLKAIKMVLQSNQAVPFPSMPMENGQQNYIQNNQQAMENFNNQQAMENFNNQQTMENFNNQQTMENFNNMGLNTNSMSNGLSNQPVYHSGMVGNGLHAEVRQEMDPTEKLNQFRKMMTGIVQEAVRENNDLFQEEVLEKVGDRVLKEMNYLIRNQEEQEEERFRKLDLAIRGNIPAEKKTRTFLGKKKKEKEPKSLLIRKTAT